jgi:toxin ParE1/3/4
VSSIHRALRAAQDILDLAKYIADENPAAANRVLDAIDSKLNVLVAHPELGVKRDDLAAGVRSSLVGNYVLYYRPHESGIELLRVLHAARDISALFQ